MTDDEQAQDKGVAELVVSELASYLGLTFKPGLESLGLLFGDQVQYWRLRNLQRLAGKLKKTKAAGRANPRVAITVLEQASTTDNETLLEMWAGLLDSSRAEDPSDANVTFAHHLAQMSSLQALIINHVGNTYPFVASGDLLFGKSTAITIENDDFFGRINRILLDQELDNLRNLGLIGGGISIEDPSKLDIQLSAIGVYLFVRCQGSSFAPVDFLVGREMEEFNSVVHAGPWPF